MKMTTKEYIDQGHASRKVIEIDSGLSRHDVHCAYHGSGVKSLRVGLAIEMATNGVVPAETIVTDERDLRLLAYLRSQK